MSGAHRKGHYGKHRGDKSKIGEKGREVLEQIDENNPVIKMFREYSLQLDEKHDRHERIVKASRDITIESKRIIFLLHSAATDIDNKRGQILSEANIRLEQLMQKNFQIVALELEGQDPYLYLRAYTAGLQEFVEAYLYYQYLKYGFIEPTNKLQEKLTYKIVPKAEGEGEGEEQLIELPIKNLDLLIPVPEFFLGLLDFTGELMRRCINSLSTGSIQDCYKICDYVRSIYTGFLGINNVGYKDMGRKIYVLKQSVLKMEYVCYTIQVRGSEVPKHMLANVINNANNDANDDDEGFY